VGTYDQTLMNTDKNVGWDAWNIYMMNPDGEYTPNVIHLQYYEDLIFSKVSTQFAYANEEKPIIIKTDFNWDHGNNFKEFRQFATFTCRFSNADLSAQVVVPAIMESSPIGAYNATAMPDQIRCRTPKWNRTETITLEVSVNGQDYMGNYQLAIVEPLRIFKISPMSGPIGGHTAVKLYGSGFTSSLPKETEVLVKFGTQEIQMLDKKSVTDVTWNEDAYHNELNLPKIIVHSAEENDVVLDTD